MDLICHGSLSINHDCSIVNICVCKFCRKSYVDTVNCFLFCLIFLDQFTKVERCSCTTSHRSNHFINHTLKLTNHRVDAYIINRKNIVAICIEICIFCIIELNNCIIDSAVCCACELNVLAKLSKSLINVSCCNLTAEDGIKNCEQICESNLIIEFINVIKVDFANCGESRYIKRVNLIGKIYCNVCHTVFANHGNIRSNLNKCFAYAH